MLLTLGLMFLSGAFGVAAGYRMRGRRIAKAVRGWTIKGVVLPDPGDPRWTSQLNPLICELTLRLGPLRLITQAGIERIWVDDVLLADGRQAARYNRAVKLAYADRKSLAAIKTD